MMTSQPGTYALVLAPRAIDPVPIGRLGTLSLQPGYYVYVGSAFGPGGLAARLRHHQRISLRPHWHIDYLRPACDLVEFWFTIETAHREHSWAKAMAQMPGAGVPMPGFGASDCQCAAHLFWFRQRPSIKTFRARVGAPASRARAMESNSEGNVRGRKD